VRVGVSLSHRTAKNLGLDPVHAFEQLASGGFRPIRLSAYWDSDPIDNYQTLDRMVAAAERLGTSIVITVGMKGMRWPEFYIPATIQQGQLATSVVDFAAKTVARYKHSRAVEAWQVENEPRNRSGPKFRLVPSELLNREMKAVAQVDGRPQIVNCFLHFTWLSDLVSRPWPWYDVVDHVLDLLSTDDVLGFDIHPFIRRKLGPIRWLSSARSTWPRELRACADRARSKGRRVWVTESQAEPWGAGSLDPARMRLIFEGIGQAEPEVVLLWGAEFWLKRQSAGDPRWLDAALSVVKSARR
jgi:hypothetical protein